MAAISNADYNWIIGQLIKRGVNLDLKCAECSVDAWRHELRTAGPLLWDWGRSAYDVSAGYIYFLMHCTNCGNVRHFNLGSLDYTPGIGG